MPTDPRKRQKQQERRAAKRKSTLKVVARERQKGVGDRLSDAAGAPLLHSWASENLWTDGIGWVCICRQLPNHNVAFSVFLVDRYCLGVKSVIANVFDRTTYDNQIVKKMRSQATIRNLQPPAARRLVEDAVTYAASLGLRPHPDYERAKRIFGDIDASQSTETLEFGKDGKPYFIGGPNDTPARCRSIMNTLERNCGHGGYHFLIPAAPDDERVANALPVEGIEVGGDRDSP